MGNKYAKRLLVSTPEGKPIYAVIIQGKENVHIEVRFLEVVQKDDPQFSNNGVIRFNIPRERIKPVLLSLTNYIESLFLKELGQEEIDEDIYSSLGVDRKSRGTKKPLAKKSIRTLKGAGSSSSIHDSPRRDESPESDRRRQDGDDMAEGRDSSIVRNDKDGD